MAKNEGPQAITAITVEDTLIRQAIFACRVSGNPCLTGQFCLGNIVYGHRGARRTQHGVRTQSVRSARDPWRTPYSARSPYGVREVRMHKPYTNALKRLIHFLVPALRSSQFSDHYVNPPDVGAFENN